MRQISDDLWHAMYEVGTEGNGIANLHPNQLAQLIEYRTVERCDDGKLLLTRFGAECFYQIEASGDPRIPGLDVNRPR